MSGLVVEPTHGDMVDDEGWATGLPEPRRAPSGGSILETLSEALENATDLYAEALDGEAEAQNAYERAFAIEFLNAGDVPVTIRSKWVDAQVVEHKLAFNSAQAKAKRCRAKVNELSARLVAAQSHIKFVGMQS